ncbi:ROK family protein [Chitinophaga sp. CF418]|uniref:ROK family protein n=1 Tax=Chitinophaga sp. CF418 TaxID=1855287 RepID=UPI000920FCCC|nr:ROK family protein [Chitinophaga sp. CF418]SHM76965.1 glucokinase [Chitinophaga sp. CF418]
MKDTQVLSVDIGGSHITTALVDMQRRTFLPDSIYREHINSHAGAAEIIGRWSYVMKKSLLAGNDVHRIGIAMPGPFDYEEGISFIKGLDKYEALYGLNVKELLEEQLGIDKKYIRIMNDASCFLQGELFNGAAKGEKEVLGLTLGTGFGSSVADNGIAQEGTFWKTPFLDATAEEYFSTRWFLRRYEELSGQRIASVKELAAIVRQSSYALTVFQEFGYNLAMFLQEQQPIPSLVVLGGNITQAFDLFRSNLEYHMEGTRFVVSELGEEAILLGAAGFWEIAG